MVGERVIDVGGLKLRAVLALLAADAGRAVSVDALVDALWAEQAPPDAVRTVRTYVSRLRRALTAVPGPGETVELIVTRPPGYLLPDPAAVDAVRFERLAAAGQRALAANEPVQAKERLVAALRLWRGAAYGEFGDVTALNVEGNRLRLVHARIVEDRIAADLAAGLGVELVVELETLTAAQPGNERLWGQLMTALYRGGRQADALAAFGRARQVLVADFGVEPSPALAAVHRRVLAQDPGLLAVRTPEPVARERRPHATLPAQLPPAVAAFTGRHPELTALDTGLDALGDGNTTSISVLSGTAGVGKTALAMHWAHSVRSRFPDGQLYANLRGFDPTGPAVDPADALHDFLAAFAVPAQSVPATLDARSALYRSLIAGKRMLVLLDNARDADQVRPLLPASPGSVVVVTSRDSLTGLVARDGARRVQLDVLSLEEALELLGVLIGEQAGRAAGVTLAEQCARLPLALRIAADLVAGGGTGGLDTVIEGLADEQSRLDLLDAGADRSTAVRAVFSWSERHLPSAGNRLFGLLGLCPGHDIDVEAIAALAGVDVARARRSVGVLSRAHLLESVAPDRWAMHDLLRVFAREQALERIDEADRRSALTALHDFYLTRAFDAMDVMFPETRSWRRGTEYPARERSVFPSRARARSWLDTERRTLGTAAVAADDDLADYAVGFARALGEYLTVGFHNDDALAIHRRALDVARLRGSRQQEARALLELGKAHGRGGDYAGSNDHYRRALAIFGDLAVIGGQARCLHEMGNNDYRIGEYPAALARFRAALDLHRRAGDRLGEAAALAASGQAHQNLGRHRDALVHFGQAAELYAAVGYRVGEGRILNDLGNALQRQGRDDEAYGHHERASHILREVGDRAAEACAFLDLGRIESKRGHHRVALDRHDYALAIFREIGDQVGEVEALVDIGAAYERMARYQDAVDHHERAHALAVDLGDRQSQLVALNGKGRARCAAGRPADALPLHHEALTHATEIGDREQQARSFEGIAAAHDRMGQRAQARDHWSKALDLYTELEMPEAGAVRQHIADEVGYATARQDG